MGWNRYCEMNKYFPRELISNYAKQFLSPYLITVENKSKIL